MPRRFTDRDLVLFRNRQGENLPVPPPPRKRPRHEESQIQGDLIKWWAVECRTHRIPERLLFAIPNGGQRSKIQAAALKREEGLPK